MGIYEGDLIVFKLLKFKNIPLGARVAIYGSGEIGIGLKNDLNKLRKDITISFFVNSFMSGELDGHRIYNVEDLSDKHSEFDIIIIAMLSPKSVNEIKTKLISLNINNIIEMDKKLLANYLVENNKNKLSFKNIFLPVLDYLETHLVDHCNLNCKGCSHFCNLADEKYTDIKQFESDFKRLSGLFKNIKVIRLMGGEPLLNPQIADFINIARKYFPHSTIKIVTNGFLLSKATANFWESCRHNKAVIDFSKYPPSKNIFASFIELCRANGVEVGIISIADEFNGFHNDKGDSNPNKAFDICHKSFYCPILKDSKIYICAKSAYVEYYNKYFNQNVPVGEAIDINISTGRQIINFLKKPVQTCKWCATKWRTFNWAPSKNEIDEWDGMDSLTK